MTKQEILKMIETCKEQARMARKLKLRECERAAFKQRKNLEKLLEA